MNEQERLELERLKQLQARLQQDLNLLSSQLQRLEQWLYHPQPEQPRVASQPPAPASQSPELPQKPIAPEIPRATPQPASTSSWGRLSRPASLAPSLK